jgi:hemoglobin-like flavoprotein
VGVAVAGHCPHQRDADAGVEWIERSEPAPPPHGRPRLALFLGTEGELFDEFDEFPLDRASLTVGPCAEIRGAGKVKSVEEGAAIASRRFLEGTPSDSGVEMLEVGGDELGVEPELLHSADGVVVPEVLAEGVEPLREGPSGAFVVSIRPQERHHPVTGDATRPRAGEEGEDGQPSRLGGGAQQRASIPLARESPQRVDAQHDGLGDFPVIRRPARRLAGDRQIYVGRVNRTSGVPGLVVLRGAHPNQPRNCAMTSREIFLVKQSFAMLGPIAEQFAPAFYARLFELDPPLRSLFRGELMEQGKKLTQMIAVVVNGLDRLDALLPAVRSLGARHHAYGVKASHFDTVGAALIWTLHRFLGDAFTRETRLAWVTAYATLAEQMAGAGAAAAQVRVA